MISAKEAREKTSQSMRQNAELLAQAELDTIKRGITRSINLGSNLYVTGLTELYPVNKSILEEREYSITTDEITKIIVINW